MDEAATVSQTRHQVLDVSTQLTSQVRRADRSQTPFPFHYTAFLAQNETSFLFLSYRG